MTVRRTAVMVVGLAPELLPLGGLLESSLDIEVSALGDFEAAKRQLAVQVPDVLITALRLGPYNGLHLILRARADNPTITTIVVVEEDDPVLRRDAEELGAAFVVGAVTAEHLQAALRITPAGSA